MPYKTDSKRALAVCVACAVALILIGYPAAANGGDGHGETTPPADASATLATICDAFTDFDLNADGVIEISHLRELDAPASVGVRRGLRRYFEIEADSDNPGGGIGRKRATFWSVLGDWTLRLPDSPVDADRQHRLR